MILLTFSAFNPFVIGLCQALLFILYSFDYHIFFINGSGSQPPHPTVTFLLQVRMGSYRCKNL